ncbi:DUF4351 domain-containing protein [Thauera sp. Sel9]|uniref:DUF4351 domain-containing protein n=1 Tax=Thauera sp. Sel9 TaxID=2974299 RepID=UPI0021E14D83|nr:DUF4351 domain-containing protein [Thauera sp. Sel9]MCV2218974.1 DUF4351 domain-containing protein [Thauera sp. Sel9]
MPVPANVSHDQNFKNLILDYPRQALEFFAPSEAQEIDDTVRITPIRQEQLKNRLGDRFHELDVPLLVEWPDGRREALLFIIEEESNPERFSIHRLGHYCLDLAELCKTDRMVPVVVFLRGGQRIRKRLELGSEHFAFLSFSYLFCILDELPVEQYRDSDNIVARLNLPNMAYPRQQVVDIFAWALRGLLLLEPDQEKRLKYMDFIDTYSALDDNERQVFSQQYPQEKQIVMIWSERMRSEGRQQGMQLGRQEGLEEGVQRGELAVLTRQLTRRFGPLDAATTVRLQQATLAELEQWAENILDAQTLEEVFGSV